MIRPEILEEADTILLTGGEIPEVVLFESLSQLESQGILPGPDEMQCLYDAVFQRYQDIIFRDLDPANRGAAVFRSPERARINLTRMSAFASNHSMDMTGFRARAADMLQRYLNMEAAEITKGKSFNTLGMERLAIETLMAELDIDPAASADNLDRIFSVPTFDWQAVRKESTSSVDSIDPS